MIALLALAAIDAVGITVKADEGQLCPSVEHVTSALAVRLGRHMAGDDANAKPFRLRLQGGPGLLQIQLSDADGVSVLSRDLHPTADASDCIALADTVALIVERYLDELEIKRLETVSPPASKRPADVLAKPWALGLAALGRSGQTALLSPGLELWVEHRLGLGRWTVAAASGGLWPDSQAVQTEQGGGTSSDAVTVDRLSVWAKLRAGPSWGVGRHDIGLKGELGLGLVRGRREAARMEPASVAWGPEPWLGARLQYRAHLGPAWFVEGAWGAAVALVRHQLLVGFSGEDGRQTVTSTPRFFTDLNLSLGVQF